MATLHRNSSFKLKSGSVKSTVGIVPEAGALLFDESIPALVVGDGFNWLPVVPEQAKSSIATTLLTPVPTVYTLGVPVLLSPWYDTVVYQFGTDITVSGGNTLTVHKDMTLDYSSQFIIQSSQNNTKILLETQINSVTISSQEVLLASNALGYNVLNIGAVPVLSGDIATVQSTVDRNCTITLRESDTGAREV